MKKNIQFHFQKESNFKFMFLLIFLQELTTLIDFEKPSHAITLLPTAITLMSKVQVKRVSPKKSMMSPEGKAWHKCHLKWFGTSNPDFVGDETENSKIKYTQIIYCTTYTLQNKILYMYCTLYYYFSTCLLPLSMNIRGCVIDFICYMPL